MLLNRCVRCVYIAPNRTVFSTKNYELLNRIASNVNFKLRQRNLNLILNNCFRKNYSFLNVCRNLHSSLHCQRFDATKLLTKNSTNSNILSLRPDNPEENETYKEKDYAQIIKDFPEPKVILHNFYQILNSELHTTHKIIPQFKSDAKRNWTCVYKLPWPSQIKVSATASSKQEASKKAAVKGLYFLKQQNKISPSGTPLIYNKYVRSIQEPYDFEISELSLRSLSAINNIYEQQIVPILSKLISTGSQAELTLDKIEEDLFTEYDSQDELKRSIDLYKHLNKNMSNKYRNQLPIAKCREELVDLIEDNRVVIVKGEPGCGKSTQVPQYILEHWIENGDGGKCNIVVTQPRRLAAISLAERVAKERNEVVGRTIGYCVRLQSNYNPRTGAVLYCTTGVLLRKLTQDPNLTNLTHVIVDEAHERDINTDILLVLLRKVLEVNPNLKVVIMSATIDAQLFQKYFNNAPALNIPGFSYPVKTYFLEDIKLPLNKTEKMCNETNPNIVPEDVATVIRWIDKNKSDGAILCFLPGWDDISKVKNILNETMDPATSLILPLHSRLTHDDQKLIFNHPPPGVRKVILATNIAETSVTIDDVIYVVDTGTHKEQRLNLDHGTECIDNHWISRSSVNQRRGRAGRVQPGESYHLFPKEKYDNMDEFSLAEVLRVSLTKVVLDAKVYSHDMKAVDFFKQLPNPPDENSVKQSVDELINLNVLTPEEQLTPLGKSISLFALPPKLSKALIYSYIFKCIDPIVNIVTILSVDTEIFSTGLEKRDLVRQIKLDRDELSDHLAMATLFDEWKFENTNGYKEALDWCNNNYINYRKMALLNKLREIHYEYLDNYDNKKQSGLFNKYSSNEELVKAVLLSGVGTVLHHRNWDVVKGRMKKSSALLTESKQRASIASESVNSKRKNFPSPFLVYAYQVHSSARRTNIIRETSLLSPLTVLLFRNKPFDIKTQLNTEDVILSQGSDVKFKCDRRTAELIQQTSSTLQDMVQLFLSHDVSTIDQEQRSKLEDAWNEILTELDIVFKYAGEKLFQQLK